MINLEKQDQRIIGAMYKAVVKKPILPILENFLLMDGCVSMDTLDLNVVYKLKGLKIEACVNAKKFSLISDNGGKLTLKKKTDDVLAIDTDDGSYELLNSNTGDFPKPRSFDSGKTVKFHLTSDHLQAIYEAKDFCGNDMLRLPLTYINVGKHIVATDANTMYYQKADLPNFLISTNVIPILKLFPEWNGEVSENGYLIKFTSSDNALTVWARGLDEKYVNYEAVIPKNFNSEAVINVKDLTAYLKKSKPFVDPNLLKVIYDFGGNSLRLSAKNLDDNSAYHKVLPVSLTGDSLKTAYNLEFMLKILKQIKTTEATIKLINERSAAVINDKYLIMPVMLLGDE